MRPQFIFRTTSCIVLTTPSDIGHVALAAGERRIRATSIGDSSGPQAARRLARILSERLEEVGQGRADRLDERLALEVLDQLVRYLDGEAVSFDDVPVDLDHLSAFQQRVAKACRAIPFGATRTYGALAASAGSPGAARAVGQVMKGNRAPLIVPCHRVVAAGGRLGGFSAPLGVSLKRRLLEMEHAAATSHHAPKSIIATRRRLAAHC
jgi:methylated-DNA-[protein]-cysteine S-methyltransferase